MSYTLANPLRSAVTGADQPYLGQLAPAFKADLWGWCFQTDPAVSGALDAPTFLPAGGIRAVADGERTIGSGLVERGFGA